MKVGQLSAQQRRAVYDLSPVNAERAPAYFRLAPRWMALPIRPRAPIAIWWPMARVS